MAKDDFKALVHKLIKSPLYREFQRSFREATGLPLVLRVVEVWQPALHKTPHENQFCGMMAEHSGSCANCLREQERLVKGRAQTITCFAGLSETAVPVRLGQQTLGFLQTGQVMLRKPDQRRFTRISDQLAGWGMDLPRASKAWSNSRVMPPAQYQATIRLLTLYADQLASAANDFLLRQQNAEPPMIARAREFIRQHQTEDLRLEQVARAVNASRFYLCKQFKKATGLGFTEFLSRGRVERAKALLLNPQKRISEVGYEVGFRSLTHFNRSFRRFVGQSPTQFRTKRVRL